VSSYFACRPARNVLQSTSSSLKVLSRTTNYVGHLDGNMQIKTEAAWTNEPAEWRVDSQGRLIARARPRSDFWRKTRNGFIADSGHLYSVQVRGDFVARLHVAGEFKEQYDQAGLMVMLNNAVWLKAGLEYVDGLYHFSSVVTHDYSDWALSHAVDAPALWVMVERDRDNFIISASLDGQRFSVARECTLTDNFTLEVGPYLAAPAGEGFVATFSAFEIHQPRQPRRMAESS